MKHPEFRKLRFDLDDTVPFQWNPSNPISGLWGNAISFLAVGWEKYILTATRDAMDLIDDTEVAEEARIFVAQEAQHAAAHRGHIRGLIAQYPGLQKVLDATHKHFDDLYAAKPLKFHLAYMAAMESTFTPVFRAAIDNRETLFADGDARVASMLLWHYVEEIEHRSSAVAIYDAVIGDPWYRLRVAPQAFLHFAALFRLLSAGFAEHVPADDLGAPHQTVRFAGLFAKDLRSRIPGLKGIGRSPGVPSMLHGLRLRDVIGMAGGVLGSQTPRHDPGAERLPDWYDTWVSAYVAGEDMAHFYGAPPEKVGRTA
ncbi:metal-dependent hydrolase [Mycobacterium celatum]|uniref:Metal-dependent hydrolase n=1 Tax=Mycobacterium celatum TaxID=28045 RepID=A0A1X1RPJ7_MYCCE|nr:metal-dependent hydrolase [Mycobacterium celatum]ORV10957.1 hypothetical protein AWB95_14195 [Mycobacterium celatum]PIB79566.1 metal-dependent hydrolase [Mycobacterium celatum]